MQTPEEHAARMIANLPEKTGKSIDEWRNILKSTSLEKHSQIVQYLKTEHTISHGFARLIASQFLDTGSNDDPVAEQYSGTKAGLKPIYDAIISQALSLGADVQVAPKKASVSLRREKQFALITPATKTRIDLGLALKGRPNEGRLVTYNAMCSHKVALSDVGEFDDVVKAFVDEAYERAQ